MSTAEAIAEIAGMLRQYQLDVTDAARQLRLRGMRRIILQMETGGGKTRSAAYLIWLAWKKGMRALFLASGRELVNKASEELWDFGVPHGVIMAGSHMDPASVYVASKETIVARCLKKDRQGRQAPLPTAQLVITDECHMSMAKGWQTLLGHYERQGATIIGLTATPARQDGRGLGDFYQGMVQAVGTSQLIREGFLVPTRVFAPYTPDLKKVRKSKGDYDRRALDKKLNKTKLVGEVVKHWQLYGENRPTIVFGCTVEHSKNLRDEFRAAGISAEHVDGETPMFDRDRMIEDFKARKFMVLCNVGVARQGVDLPLASCIVLVRPTVSFVLFRQMVGRGKRIDTGKKDCILIDHAGAVWHHGMPDDDVTWLLEKSSNINKETAEKAKGEDKPLTCPKCYAMFKGTAICPNCGHSLKAPPKKIVQAPGMLVEVSGVLPELHEEEKVRYWHKCLGTTAHRGQSLEAARAIFYQKYKHWPNETWKNVGTFEQRKEKVADLYPQYLSRKRG